VALLNAQALAAMGSASIGRSVKVSDRAPCYGVSRIHLGDNVRIDDFCVFSAGEGGIRLGRNIHVAVYACRIGAGRITLGDFSNISSRVAICSISDDHSGATMTNPTVPDKYKNVDHADIHIGRHVLIGSGTIVLPGAVLEDGVARRRAEHDARPLFGVRHLRRCTGTPHRRAQTRPTRCRTALPTRRSRRDVMACH
jgi:dTDP-4-amino-4,6-dideoxy-D-glucose acyltransferase